MTKNWSILYRGVLAEMKLTRRGAEARAFELAKQKGWTIAEIEVKENGGLNQ